MSLHRRTHTVQAQRKILDKLSPCTRACFAAEAVTEPNDKDSNYNDTSTAPIQRGRSARARLAADVAVPPGRPRADGAAGAGRAQRVQPWRWAGLPPIPYLTLPTLPGSAVTGLLGAPSTLEQPARFPCLPCPTRLLCVMLVSNVHSPQTIDLPDQSPTLHLSFKYSTARICAVCGCLALNLQVNESNLDRPLGDNPMKTFCMSMQATSAAIKSSGAAAPGGHDVDLLLAISYGPTLSLTVTGLTLVGVCAGNFGSNQNMMALQHQAAMMQAVANAAAADPFGQYATGSPPGIGQMQAQLNAVLEGAVSAAALCTPHTIELGTRYPTLVNRQLG